MRNRPLKAFASPLRDTDPKKLEFFKETRKNRKTKIQGSLIAEIKPYSSTEQGTQEAGVFGALNLRKKFKNKSSIDVTGSKVFERGSNITALETKFTNPKNLSVGLKVSKGKFTENDPYEGKITTSTQWKPSITTEYRGKKDDIYKAELGKGFGKIHTSFIIPEKLKFKKRG